MRIGNYSIFLIGIRLCHREKIFSLTLDLMELLWVRPEPKPPRRANGEWL